MSFICAGRGNVIIISVRVEVTVLSLKKQLMKKYCHSTKSTALIWPSSWQDWTVALEIASREHLQQLTADSGPFIKIFCERIGRIKRFVTTVSASSSSLKSVQLKQANHHQHLPDEAAEGANGQSEERADRWSDGATTARTHSHTKCRTINGHTNIWNIIITGVNEPARLKAIIGSRVFIMH